MIAAGYKVNHGRLGDGLVIEIRHSGYDAKVDFNGFGLWVPVSALTVLDKDPEIRVAGSLARREKAPQQEKHFLQAIVESLRLGIVPDASLEDWTVGRDEEFRKLDQWLGDEAEGTLIVEGRYGSGKTHLLRHLATKARNEGYAVSLVRIDPGEENGSFPMRFYRSVMRNLQIPHGGALMEIHHALRETALRTADPSILNHPSLGPLVKRIRNKTETDEDWRGLMGERSSSSLFPTGLDFTTVANLACNLLSAVSHFLAFDIGLKGMLILVDEVETAEVRRYHYHWKRTLNFLRGLSLTANDDDILDEKATRDRTTEAYRGARTGLVYSGHYPDVHYYYRFPTRLKVLLALTECRVSGTMREWKLEQPRIVLSDIDARALTRLYQKFRATYGQLHSTTVPPHLERWVIEHLLLDAYHSASIRGFTKALVESFDFARHYPGEAIEALAAFREF